MTRPILVIGNRNYSSWSMRGWLVLAHAGVDFDLVRIPLFTAGYQDAIARHSPSGRVPVYVDGGTTVWDSLAICEYIAENHPELWPSDAGERARARSISAEMHSGFPAVREELPMNCRAVMSGVETSTGARREIERINDIWAGCRNDNAASGPWLFGRFSIADVMFAPVASRFNTYGIELDRPGKEYRDTVLSHPDVKRWYEDSRQETEVLELYE